MIDKEGYIVVSLEAINKIREAIGKPLVRENMMLYDPFEDQKEEEVIVEQATDYDEG